MTPPMTEQDYLNAQLNQGQQALDNDPNAIHADMLRQEEATTFLKQLNPDNLMVDIEHRIRGEKKDSRGEWVKINREGKQISEELVSNFMSFLGAILNQNMSMSNFSTMEINNLMELIISYVGRDLDVNDEKYGIEGDYTEMDRISIIINSSCFAVLKQAMNGQLSRRMFGVMKIQGSLVEEKKPSLVDALKVWN